MRRFKIYVSILHKHYTFQTVLLHKIRNNTMNRNKSLHEMTLFSASGITVEPYAPSPHRLPPFTDVNDHL